MRYIYIIENLINGKAYIGQTKNKTKRRVDHFSLLRHNKHHNDYLQRAWNKYGEEAFEFNLLDSSESPEEIDRIEVLLIAWYKELDLCYNHESGGHVLIEHSPETIEKLRQATLKQFENGMPEETKQKIGEASSGREPWNKGKSGYKNGPASEETIEKNRQARLGKKDSEETKKTKSEAQKKRHEEKPMTEETKEKMGKLKKEHWEREEYRELMKIARSNQVMWHKGLKGCWSEESNQKRREALSGEKNYNYGKHIPEETKEKIRVSQRITRERKLLERELENNKQVETIDK